MDKNTWLFYKSALALHFDCHLEDCINGFTITLANQRYYLREGLSPFNIVSNVNVVSNKSCVNSLLQHAGLPVPKALAFTKQGFEENNVDFEDIQFPVVAKPTRGTSSGTDVFCNIPDKKTLFDYLKKMFLKHPVMSVEEFQSNLTSYRVLVFNNAVIGVVERIPAHVIGDGIHTLHELIAITNDQRKLLTEKMAVGPIEMGIEQQTKLSDMGMTLTDIPKKNERIQLCYKCNSAVGGTIRTADHEICKENIALALRATKVINLDLVGFDILCEDIGKPIGPTRGFIIEANSNPDVSIHELSMEGATNCVTRKILWGLVKRHPIAYFWMRIKKSSLKIYLRCALLIASFFLLKHFFKG
ncbi:MAG: hypothetical protein A3F13_09000 [Gammaproteobacteria bacterium RIFCSPHIGHO2_12_FULL_40_19]|nr:MAG: hypothetical protein A3F13_09000 [Gammaproteobacteria bacterium RIFCSPHIGHO2_12_FULL_40_19]